MRTPQDQILALALEEVVGGHQPPDLETRILERTRRLSRRVTRRRIGLAIAALLLAVVAIRAVLLRREPTPEPLAPALATLTADEKTRAEAWIALQRESMGAIDPSNPADVQRLQSVRESRSDLLDLLDAKPAGWAWTRARLLPLPEGFKSAPARGRLLAILGRQPGAETDPLILERIRDDSREMSVGTLLVLAERGSAPARALLERRLASARPFPALALPAAFLALGGDDRGEAAMRMFVSRPRLRESQPAVALACAAGFDRLGDPATWTDMTTAQVALAEGHLAAGDLDAARRIVAALTLVRPAIASEATIRLGDIGRRAASLARVLRAELPTADTIRARLAALVD